MTKGLRALFIYEDKGMRTVTRDEIDEHLKDLVKQKKQVDASYSRLQKLCKGKHLPLEQLKRQQEIMLEQMARTRATMQFLLVDAEAYDG